MGFLRRALLIAVGASLVIAATGCRKKLSFDRWATLQPGDSRKSVEAAFGKPLDERGPRLVYTRHDEGIAVEAWFDRQTDRLIYTQWADPVHGIRTKGTRPERE